jgi:hypothetical protein
MLFYSLHQYYFLLVRFYDKEMIEFRIEYALYLTCKLYVLEYSLLFVDIQ